MSQDSRPEKRGKWWVRLCIDLKHLKLRKECLKVAEYALLEVEWVKTGSKNALFRMKEQLAKGFKKKEPKPKTKKSGKKWEESEEEKDDKEVQKMIKDVKLTQNVSMLT